MGLKVEITFDDWHGRIVYCLLEDVRISVAGTDFVIPRGTLTDFMSIPAFMRGFVGIVTKRAAASLLHDWLINNQILKPAKADWYFREALKELGMGKLERNLYYAAVRANSMSKGLVGSLLE